ncbi:bifunctional demethylmenaquinone methyltransferase/2-methoxy-6-polyprenyl-1,4-benzoquinol methylase UbiE [Candidatus Cyanaurora vandensis]|uniref:bifunctional demethylmenaquinone methyltransferase/2-methoxy-6-polyprenyl-1,4-benzoquinol methylase UbiE n=1 Tax=Candidatus Cyanaurora vandensis TaxID=2714958 RepID=UPI00257BE56C|nr:bifunctional demethylmenaquinone methyltransferase/2-methoxy-6-polyprenyl-1,4-benzoquinol methylase UbiE [Candidatus Cyanaurora vandensis]
MTPTPNPTLVRDLFDQIAPRYNQINTLMSWGRHLAWKRLAAQWCFPAQPLGEVVDLCCGTGDLTRQLARVVPRAEVIWGVDFAEGMLRQARQRVGLDRRIRWLQADVLDLPFAAGQMDGVTMAFGLRNVGDIPQCLGEIERILKPGARAVILDLCLRQDDGFQRWYLTEVVPRLGAWFNLADQYAYLAPSLERFPEPPALALLARQVGFRTVTHRSLENGGIHFLVLQK